MCQKKKSVLSLRQCLKAGGTYDVQRSTRMSKYFRPRKYVYSVDGLTYCALILLPSFDPSVELAMMSSFSIKQLRWLSRSTLLTRYEIDLGAIECIIC